MAILIPEQIMPIDELKQIYDRYRFLTDEQKAELRQLEAVVSAQQKQMQQANEPELDEEQLASEPELEEGEQQEKGYQEEAPSGNPARRKGEGRTARDQVGNGCAVQLAVKQKWKNYSAGNRPLFGKLTVVAICGAKSVADEFEADPSKQTKILNLWLSVS